MCGAAYSIEIIYGQDDALNINIRQLQNISSLNRKLLPSLLSVRLAIALCMARVIGIAVQKCHTCIRCFQTADWRYFADFLSFMSSL